MDVFDSVKEKSSGVNDSFVVSVGKRYGMLFCSWLLCYLIASVIMGFVLMGGSTPAKVRICLVLQDLFVFIVPAIATAVVINRRPADFLQIERPRSVWPFVMIVFLLLSLMPALNAVISWNQSIVLPESMSGLYDWMIQSERAASETMSNVTGSTSVGGLIISLLIIGVLAGFSEELFFRGALQRTLTTTPINPHVAIWLTAFLFSAMHLQFFGFFPRMILGALFGYMAYWSGSIWLPVAAHILNNSMAVVAIWIKNRSNTSVVIDTIGSGADGSDPTMIIVGSVVFTSIWLFIIWRWFKVRRN